MKDPELVVEYFPDSDTLRLGAGVPPEEGETIAKWLMVEWNKNDEVTGVVLRNASKVLRPYLFPDEDDLGQKGRHSQGKAPDERTASSPSDSKGDESNH